MVCDRSMVVSTASAPAPPASALADRGSARIEQHAFADFLTRGELDRHLTSSPTTAAEKLSATRIWACRRRVLSARK